MVRTSTDQHKDNGAAHETNLASVQTVYFVPTAEVFQRFAQHIGEQMSELSGEAGYSEQSVVDGLAHFLQVVSELLVRQLNRDRHAAKT
ncbi:MAG: hypothetical protein IPM16_10770 [Chloroflexi bacterium]|nr:hypothetical protein [Chloroflexota bacterium]